MRNNKKGTGKHFAGPPPLTVPAPISSVVAIAVLDLGMLYLLLLGSSNHHIVDFPLFFIVVTSANSIACSCPNRPHLN